MTCCEKTRCEGFDLPTPWVEDFTPPDLGKGAYFLTTGVAGGVESSLGQNSQGNERSNENPCP